MLCPSSWARTCRVAVALLALTIPGWLPAQEIPALKGFSGLGNPGFQDAIQVSGQFRVNEDGVGRLEVRVELGSEWHIYSVTQPAGGPIRTTVDLQPVEGLEISGDFRPNVSPEVKKSPYFDVPEELHHGAVTWSVPVRLGPGMDPSQVILEGEVNGQICREGQCVLLSGIDTSFRARYAGDTLPDEISGGDLGAATASSARPIDWRELIVNLCLGLASGFILNFMPCVLPVIGLKAMSFVQQSHGDRRRAFMLNIVYSAGVISVFLLLAVLSISLGLAWGEQFSYSWFKIALILVVFAMALSFLGVWEIPIPGFVGSGQASQLATREGPAGAFFKGVFATILATPCSGPLMGTLFSSTLDASAPVKFALFFSMGLGMALPYLVIGAVPELARWMPKPGPWMDTFKELMGFLLLATVVFLFYTLGDAKLFVPTLATVVGVWFACWMVGRVSITAPASTKFFSWVTGLAVAGLVGYVAFRPADAHLEWQEFSPSKLEAAQRDGKTVMLDFTANWCANCKVNQHIVLDSKQVAEEVRKFGVVPMLADWTDRESPEGKQVKAALESLGHKSIPLLVIYPADRPDEPIVLPDLLQRRQVIDALRQAGPSRSSTAKGSLPQGSVSQKPVGEPPLR